MGPRHLTRIKLPSQGNFLVQQEQRHQLRHQLNHQQQRWLLNSTSLLSGHNRWSKIKHDKGKEDALKSKARTILSQDIINASKYGGADLALNPRLVIAINAAKKGQLSKASIDSAIAKGQGKSVSGAPLENLTIEAILPHGVAAMIECQTESKARVLQDIRWIITKNGGTVTPTAFLFKKKGKVWFSKQDRCLSADDALDEAIEAGAEDVGEEDGMIVVETAPADVSAVAARLQERLKVEIDRTEIVYIPKEDSAVTLDDAQGAEIEKILDYINEDPSLQNLYVNAVSS